MVSGFGESDSGTAAVEQILYSESLKTPFAHVILIIALVLHQPIDIVPRCQEWLQTRLVRNRCR